MAGGAWALPGRAKVQADDLAKGSVTAKALAKGSVGAPAIAAGAAGTSEVARAAITEAELAAQSVGSGELKRINQRTVNVKVAAGKLGEGDRLVRERGEIDLRRRDRRGRARRGHPPALLRPERGRGLDARGFRTPAPRRCP